MPIRDLHLARDYNRSIARPIRWIHIAAAAARTPLDPLCRWFAHPSRSTWAPHLVLGALGVWLLLPYDAWMLDRITSLRIGGDLRREIEAAQQYGQGLSSLLVALVIWLQDPARRRRLADWLLAFVLTGIIATALKILLARPRPLLDEPEIFLGPLGAYPLGPDVGFRSSWQFWDVHTTKLWSMPSSHTAYIAVMAVFLAATYPRLRYLVFPMIAVVGFGRAVSGSHYITDIIAGIAVGVAVAHTTVHFRWGQRLLDATLRRLLRRGDPVAAPGPPTGGVLTNAARESTTPPVSTPVSSRG
jgi:membrane-associated phospholipid phosphatase